MTKTTRSRQPMTKIDVTHAAPRLDPTRPGVRASRGNEIWAANSACGTWSYVRLEERGTPWLVTHNPTGWTTTFGSLPKARRWTASDRVIADMRHRIQIEILNCQRSGRHTIVGDRLCSAVEAEKVYAAMLIKLTALAVLAA